LWTMLYRENDLQVFEGGRLLPIVEDFYTIQGEGFHMGKPAYFVRVGGCDIGCSWCDTKFSWNPAIHPLNRVDEIMSRIRDNNASVVVVTGGEPLIYPMDYLTNELHRNKIEAFIETSGAYKISGTWDWICLSPKKNSPPKTNIFKMAHELKVIIQNEKDIEWAEKNAGLVSPSCLLFLQPEWSNFTQITPVLVEYVKVNQRWRISLQAHKFMKIP
jgi:7-carboxy-7-deazaguanine synthase